MNRGDSNWKEDLKKYNFKIEVHADIEEEKQKLIFYLDSKKRLNTDLSHPYEESAEPFFKYLESLLDLRKRWNASKNVD